MRLREVFARNLRRLRGARNWSQEELADRAGIDRTYISSLERCVYSASLDKIEKIAGALGVDPAAMLRQPARARRKRA